MTDYLLICWSFATVRVLVAATRARPSLEQAICDWRSWPRREAGNPPNFGPFELRLCAICRETLPTAIAAKRWPVAVHMWYS